MVNLKLGSNPTLKCLVPPPALLPMTMYPSEPSTAELPTANGPIGLLFPIPTLPAGVILAVSAPRPV